MLAELKQKVMKQLLEMTEDDIVKEHVYVCGNDGVACFNGAIARIVKGCEKYDPDTVREDIDNRLWDDAFDWYQHEVRQELLNQGLEGEDLERKIQEAMDNYEPQIDYSEGEHQIESELANEVTSDLREIYDNFNDTLADINLVHEQYVDGKIDFEFAMERVVSIIENSE